MILIEFYLFLIILSIHNTFGIYSIECCTGDDNTCSSKPVDCPSNICFKLVIGKLTEERGCVDDLIKLLNYPTKGNLILTSESSNDQCHRLGIYGNGMSLCKCMTHLCNSSSKIIYLKKSILTFIILSLQYFLHVFLS